MKVTPLRVFDWAPTCSFHLLVLSEKLCWWIKSMEGPQPWNCKSHSNLIFRGRHFCSHSSV